MSLLIILLAATIPSYSDSLLVNKLTLPYSSNNLLLKNSVINTKLYSLNDDNIIISSKNGNNSNNNNSFNNKTLAITSLLMLLISGPLGMLLDNYHGLFNTLTYINNNLAITIIYKNIIVLKSAVWVPILFGLAGVVMSVIILYLDNKLMTERVKRLPSWPKVLYSISFFSLQYYISGLLDYVIPTDTVTIHTVLAVMTVIGYLIFDGSIAGFLLGLATAIAGPVAEVFLINVPRLYYYTNADIVGINSWIPWVYFLGAPAVGNLARRIYHEIDNYNRSNS